MDKPLFHTTSTAISMWLMTWRCMALLIGLAHFLLKTIWAKSQSWYISPNFHCNKYVNVYWKLIIVTHIGKKTKFLLQEHDDVPVPQGFKGSQFRKVYLQGFRLGLSKNDNCCAMANGQIVNIMNILKAEDGRVCLFGIPFEDRADFYTTPCASSLLVIYLVSRLQRNYSVCDLAGVMWKCVLLPFEKDKFVAFPMMHLMENV